MESVVGVIVVLSYSKDWAVRDFTKYEVLESNLSSAFLSKKKKLLLVRDLYFYFVKLFLVAYAWTKVH